MADISIPPISAAPVQSVSDQVFGTLHNAIVALNLPPGTKVSEADIAKQLDVSRQPVRDAFFRLSKLGFLAIRPQRATLITKISQRAVLDAAFVRTALEVECLRLCIERITKDGLADLRAILARQAEAYDVPDRGVFHALDDDFHRQLCHIAGRNHVWDLIQEQKAHMDRVRYLTLSEPRRRTVQEEHSGIVDAIEVGDAAEAERLLRAHLGDIRNVIPVLRQEHPAYFEDDTK